MKPRVKGNTIFDDDLACRCCGHQFTTSTGQLAMPVAVFDHFRGGTPSRDLLDRMDIACPKCRSIDIVALSSGKQT